MGEPQAAEVVTRAELQQLEARMKLYYDTLVDARVKALESRLESYEVELNAWRSKVEAPAPIDAGKAGTRLSKKKGTASKNVCCNCGGVSAVHRHRELGCYLD